MNEDLDRLKEAGVKALNALLDQEAFGHLDHEAQLTILDLADALASAGVNLSDEQECLDCLQLELEELAEDEDDDDHLVDCLDWSDDDDDDDDWDDDDDDYFIDRDDL